MNLKQLDAIYKLLFVFLMSFGLFLILVFIVSSERKETPALERKELFSCYELQGVRCTVRSNKENPCSYTFLVCKTPEGKTIYRSENIK